MKAEAEPEVYGALEVEAVEEPAAQSSLKARILPVLVVAGVIGILAFAKATSTASLRTSVNQGAPADAIPPISAQGDPDPAIYGNHATTVHEEICGEGQVLVGPHCHDCLAGTFQPYALTGTSVADDIQYRPSECILCPPGFYQDEDLATDCKSCGTGKTTCPTATATEYHGHGQPDGSGYDCDHHRKNAESDCYDCTVVPSVFPFIHNIAGPGCQPEDVLSFEDWLAHVEGSANDPIVSAAGTSYRGSHTPAPTRRAQEHDDGLK